MKTLKFLWQSLYKNEPVITQPQKWWLAVIIFFVSLIFSVSGTLIQGYQSDASVIYTTTYETALDKGYSYFAQDIDDYTSGYDTVLQDDDILAVVDGKLIADGKFAYVELNETTAAAGSSIEPQATYTQVNGDEEITILDVYCFNGVDPINNSTDLTLISTFVDNHILEVDSSGTATAVPHSYMIYTPTSVQVVVYKAIDGTATDSSIASVIGDLTTYDNFDLGTLKYTDGELATSDEIIDNLIAFVDEAYSSVKIQSAWIQTGVYAAMNAGVILVGGLIFFISTRSKGSRMHFKFLESLKIGAFLSLTPAIITFITSFFFSTYSSYVFLLVFAFRLMSSISKLSADNAPKNDKPLYQARS